MAVKKNKKAKKTTVNKPVKKPVKKAAVNKKSSNVKTKKAPTKKVAKKIVKKSVSKKLVKQTKTIKPLKAPVKKVVEKNKTTMTKPAKQPVLKTVQNPPVKSKVASAKKPAVESMNIQHSHLNKKISVAKPLERDVFEEIAVIEPIETVPSRKATTLLGSLEFTPYQAASDEAYMNENQKNHFRKILNAWKQQLMQDVDLTVGHLKEEAVFYADPVDRAAQEEGFNLELRTRDRERKLIKKIEQSLDLITSGEYGYCEDCGAEIGIRRLEARPTAVKCIDCKTFQEIREKQLGG